MNRIIGFIGYWIQRHAWDRGFGTFLCQVVMAAAGILCLGLIFLDALVAFLRRRARQT